MVWYYGTIVWYYGMVLWYGTMVLWYGTMVADIAYYTHFDCIVDLHGTIVPVAIVRPPSNLRTRVKL